MEKYNEASENIRNLYDDIGNYIESLGDDVVRHQTKIYLAFRKVRNIVCLRLYKEWVLLTLALNPETVEESPGYIRNVKNIGHLGTGDVEVKIRNDEDFEKSKYLLDRAYNEN